VARNASRTTRLKPEPAEARLLKAKRAARRTAAVRAVHPAAADSSGVAYAKLFKNGRSQAVRLPKAFRIDADRVRIRRVPEGILLETEPFDVEAWFKRMDAACDEPFMPQGREQPPMPAEKKLFE
jgi:antitoxin VapB